MCNTISMKKSINEKKLRTLISKFNYSKFIDIKSIKYDKLIDVILKGVHKYLKKICK